MPRNPSSSIPNEVPGQCLIFEALGSRLEPGSISGLFYFLFYRKICYLQDVSHQRGGCADSKASLDLFVTCRIGQENTECSSPSVCRHGGFLSIPAHLVP